jgi:hypothetical protein
MTNHPAPWRLVYESYPCPKCGVPAGFPCRTKSGQQADMPHADRTRMADRCPVCGAIVANDADPGGLCARCRLVRSLETERATTWKRQDPD